MDIFKTISPLVAVVVLVCAAWPLNLPLMALAVKVRRGALPLDYEDGREYWLRCALASFGVAVFAWVVLGLLFALIDPLEPTAAAGAIHAAALLGLIAAAAGFLFWALALEDFFQALGVFGIYVLVAGLPLALLGWVTGWGAALARLAPWLIAPG